MKPFEYAHFLESLHQDQPDVHWPSGLKALWYDAKGNWEMSHDIAQDMSSTLGSWIHAYLHRKEGDRFNAGYWYRRADRSYPQDSLDAEFKRIVVHVLGNMS